MEYKTPTYEEYCKASEYAKIRYKFGVYIQIIATILLIVLLGYTILNIEEMKANPITYAEEKLGVVCYYPLSDNPPEINLDYIQNGSRRNIKDIEQG